MNLVELQQKYKQQILQIATKYKVDDIKVFGSTVRNEARENSDIDFLVHFREEASLLDEAGLDIELSELLKCKVDIISDRAIREEFKPFILREAKSL